jgi:hypothetical protein
VGISTLLRILSLRLLKGYIQACYSVAGVVFIDEAKKQQRQETTKARNNKGKKQQRQETIKPRKKAKKK